MWAVDIGEGGSRERNKRMRGRRTDSVDYAVSNARREF